ncbi:MAG: VPLPA-CTERM sorting domain-containing protein [Pseudomonadota bacterium]|nr:VPLPA-CTERM sorting domain-containing protein [Pseudomonadota bacterium]
MRPAVALASALAVLSASGAAFAAPCTSSTSGTCFIVDGGLSESNPIAIEDQNVAPGSYEAEGSFSIDPGVVGAQAFADVAFDEILPGQSAVASGFSNLTISFMQGGVDLGSFLLTNPDGTTQGGSALQSFVVSFISSADIFFKITGNAFLNSGAALPDFNINLSAVAGEVPIPASFLLLLSGVAGLSFAARRKKPEAV